MPLQIHDPRERRLVQLVDFALAPLAWRRGAARPRPVNRVLLMRLERIGDLLMVLDAIGDARAAWPEATIDLVVGGWNAPLARLIPEVSRVETADAPWLARGGQADAWSTLVGKADAWRRGGYDLVLNFEPDLRSNALAWLTRAPRRIGYSSGGGGGFLTDASIYDASSHVSLNARRLVARATGLGEVPRHTPGGPRLHLPDGPRNRARRLLARAIRPLVGVHASGGRESKQWHVDRFAAAAAEVARARSATIVLTGSAADRPIVEEVLRRLPDVPVIDTCGTLDLLELAALLGELDLLITGDTGPMHLAAAMGTPIVALFGPSNPVRYGPTGSDARVLRVDLPCSPCGQVRLPPARCRGHVPDCLDGIGAPRVVAAALELLDRRLLL